MLKFLKKIMFKTLIFISTLLFSSYTLIAQFQQIGVDYANQLIEENANNPLFTVLDVRTISEYEAGHLPNAYRIDFYDSDFEQQIDQLDKNRIYLIYCQAGFRSGLSYPMMQNLGFEEVYDMLGGFGAWGATNYPISFEPEPNIQEIYPSNNCGSTTFSFETKVFLEGYFNGENQSLLLNDKNLLPNQQPFGNSVSNINAMLNNNDAVVDWIGVCIHNNIDEPAIECLATLLLTNGEIVTTNNESCVSFTSASNNQNYHISIHHEGHLSLYSNVTVSSGQFYDFTTSIENANGIEAMKNVNGFWVAFGGDFDNNGIVNNLDFNNWSNEGASVNTYVPADADGNGIVNNLDYNVWALNRSKVGKPFSL